jgi:hypothetical protein
MAMKKQILLDMRICKACTFPSTPQSSILCVKKHSLLPVAAIDYINVQF